MEVRKSLDEIHREYISDIGMLQEEYEAKKNKRMNQFIYELQQFNGIILDESDSTKGENGK